MSLHVQNGLLRVEGTRSILWWAALIYLCMQGCLDVRDAQMRSTLVLDRCIGHNLETIVMPERPGAGSLPSVLVFLQHAALLAGLHIYKCWCAVCCSSRHKEFTCPMLQEAMEVAAVGVGMASRLLQGPMVPLRVAVAATDRPMACMGLHLQVSNIDKGW